MLNKRLLCYASKQNPSLLSFIKPKNLLFVPLPLSIKNKGISLHVGCIFHLIIPQFLVSCPQIQSFYFIYYIFFLALVILNVRDWTVHINSYIFRYIRHFHAKVSVFEFMSCVHLCTMGTKLFVSCNNPPYAHSILLAI